MRRKCQQGNVYQKHRKKSDPWHPLRPSNNGTHPHGILLILKSDGVFGNHNARRHLVAACGDG